MPKLRYKITIHGWAQARNQERLMGTASKSIKRICKMAAELGLLPAGQTVGTSTEVFNEPLKEKKNAKI
jgi:hypothetical protein